MDDNQLNSKMKKLRHSLERIPTRTDKTIILKEINQKLPKKNNRRIWMYVATVTTLLIFSLLVVSTFYSFNFNQIFTTGSGNNQVLDLTEFEVEIHADESRLGSYQAEVDGELEQLVPTAITYAFKLRNNGNRFIGNLEGEINREDFTYENGIKLELVPNDQLIEISEEVLGFNLFHSEARLGTGYNGPIYLQPNQEGQFELHYTIGAAEENEELPLIPSQEKLDILLAHAAEVELLIYVSDEEITRFQLSNFEE